MVGERGTNIDATVKLKYNTSEEESGTRSPMPTSVEVVSSRMRRDINLDKAGLSVRYDKHVAVMANGPGRITGHFFHLSMFAFASTAASLDYASWN